MCRSHQISPVTIVSNSAFDFVNTCNVSCILKAALALGIHHLALRLTIQTNALITLLELYAATHVKANLEKHLGISHSSLAAGPFQSGMFVD